MEPVPDLIAIEGSSTPKPTSMVGTRDRDGGAGKVVASRSGRKTRNSLARSTRSLVARLELGSFEF